MTDSKFPSLYQYRGLHQGYKPEVEGETTVRTDRTYEKLKTIQKLDRGDLSFHLVPVGQSRNNNYFPKEARRRLVVSAS